MSRAAVRGVGGKPWTRTNWCVNFVKVTKKQEEDPTADLDPVILARLLEQERRMKEAWAEEERMKAGEVNPTLDMEHDESKPECRNPKSESNPNDE